MEIDFPSARRSLRRLHPPACGGHPGPREEKSEEKSGEKIEEVISRPFVCGEGCAGKPGETVKAHPGRSGRVGCGLPGAPRLPRPRCVRPVEKSRTGCAGAAVGRASAQAHRGRVLLANPVSAGPFGSPWVRKGRTTKNRRPDRRARRPVTACLPAASHYCLLTSVHDCPALVGIGRHWSDKNIAPEQVSAHRPPFSVGLTTSAVHRSCRRPPGCFRCG